MIISFPLEQSNTLTLVTQDYSWQKVNFLQILTLFGFFYCQYDYFIQLLNYYFWFFFSLFAKTKVNKKTLCVVAIAMIYSNLASLWTFQYFRRPVYNPVEHLWWSFYCNNSKLLSIFTKKLHHRCLLGSKHASAFWRLFKRFSSLKYFTL